MTKQIICDGCGKAYSQLLDEVLYTDEQGVEYVFDRCAKCRKEYRQTKEQSNKSYLDKLAKKNK